MEYWITRTGIELWRRAKVVGIFELDRGLPPLVWIVIAMIGFSN
jgi:hypothetical protein